MIIFGEHSDTHFIRPINILRESDLVLCHRGFRSFNINAK